jgi:hypothetical protein
MNEQLLIIIMIRRKRRRMISVIAEAPAVAPEAAGRHNNANHWRE